MPKTPQKKLHLITAVVQHKVGNAVIDAALKAGATGATCFFAQGTGVCPKCEALWMPPNAGGGERAVRSGR